MLKKEEDEREGRGKDRYLSASLSKTWSAASWSSVSDPCSDDSVMKEVSSPSPQSSLVSSESSIDDPSDCSAQLPLDASFIVAIFVKFTPDLYTYK